MQYNLVLGIEAGLFYVIAYGLMKCGAFLVADQFSLVAGSPETSRMEGLGSRYPFLGFAFTMFIFGLIGVPATAGFFGKLLIVQAGVIAATPASLCLVLILLANSAISLGVYIPILSTLMFRGGAVPEKAVVIPLGVSISILALLVVNIYLGLFPPQTLFSWIGQASSTLLPCGVP